jgi:hypothetical protein
MPASISTTTDAGGAESGKSRVNTAKEKAFEYLGVLIKWIPSEIIAVYGAVVATQVASALANGTTVKPDWSLWWIMLAATPIYVVVVAFATQSQANVFAKAVISVPAFALWTATVPGSIWGAFEWFQKTNGVGFVLVALLAGLIALVGNKLAPGQSVEE